MKRDYSEAQKQNLLRMVAAVTPDNRFESLIDWFGDGAANIRKYFGGYNILNYLDNMDKYHRSMIDKDNVSADKIKTIFNNVAIIDTTCKASMTGHAGLIRDLAATIKKYSSAIIIGSPSFCFQNSLNSIVNSEFYKNYKDNCCTEVDRLLKRGYDYLKDRLCKEVNGEFVLNEELLYDYIKKSPGSLSDGEQAAIIETIAKLKQVTVTYETLSTMGTDALGADLINYVSWMADSTEYESFAAVSAHYGRLYTNLLNFISEKSKDKNTLAASLVNIGVDSTVLSLIGVEYKEDVGKIFGSTSFDVYAAKFISEHTEEYFLKLELSEKNSLKGSMKINKVNDAIKDKLKQKGLYDEKKKTYYFDENGNEIDKKDAPTFYKTVMSVAEAKKLVSLSGSIYEGNVDLGDYGDLGVTVGNAEMHASGSAGLYVLVGDGEDKRKVFSPGVNAEVGASATALDIEWNDQLVGDKNLGLNAKGEVIAGQASATAGVKAQVIGEDGKLNLQANANVKAEAIAAKAEGKVGVNVLGGEVGVKGGVQFGIGASADVGLRDGKFKVEISASAGLGVSLGVEVDVGGMVNTVCSNAKSAWNGTKDLFSSLF